MRFDSNINIKENLGSVLSKIAYNCKKLKRNGLIPETYTVNGTVDLTSNNIRNGKPVKVLHITTPVNMFPNFEFDACGEANDLADKSHQSRY